MLNLSDKIGLTFDNIVLKHGFGIVKTRSECDISVNIGEKQILKGISLEVKQ